MNAGLEFRLAHDFVKAGIVEVAEMNSKPPQIATFFEKLMSCG